MHPNRGPKIGRPPNLVRQINQNAPGAAQALGQDSLLNFALEKLQNIFSVGPNLMGAAQQGTPQAYLDVAAQANPFNPNNAFSSEPMSGQTYQYDPKASYQDHVDNPWMALMMDVLEPGPGELGTLARLRGLPSRNPAGRNADKFLDELPALLPGGVRDKGRYQGNDVFEVDNDDLRLNLDQRSPENVHVAFMANPQQSQGRNSVRGMDQMLDMLAAADRHGISLTNSPQAMGRVRQDSLEDMYRAVGFEQPDPLDYMKRKPVEAVGELYHSGFSGKDAFTFERSPGFSKLSEEDQLDLLRIYSDNIKAGRSWGETAKEFDIPSLGIPEKELKRFEKMYGKGLERFKADEGKTFRIDRDSPGPPPPSPSTSPLLSHPPSSAFDSPDLDQAWGNLARYGAEPPEQILAWERYAAGEIPPQTFRPHLEASMETQGSVYNDWFDDVRLQNSEEGLEPAMERVREMFPEMYEVPDVPFGYALEGFIGDSEFGAEAFRDYIENASRFRR